MSGSVNKVILLGNVGKDPEIRSTQDGREIANITLATSEKWRDKSSGERKEKAEWHRVVVFTEGLVNIVKNYVKKGSKLYIEGSLQTRKWVDNTGNERYTTEIALQGYNSVLVMVDSSRNSENIGSADYSYAGASSSSEAKPALFEDNLDDEVPF